MATAMKRDPQQGAPVTQPVTSRARRIRVGQDERQAMRAEARATTAAAKPVTPAAHRLPFSHSAHNSHSAYGDAPLGAIIRGYDPGDRRLFRVVRRAGEVDWPEASEPTARISEFRAWLRSLPGEAVVGVAASVERDPIATWLRETRDYAHVRVRAGQMGVGMAGTVRAAHFIAYDHGHRAVGMGYLDAGLCLGVDWLDGAGLDDQGAPRLLRAGEALAMLDEMTVAWPSPDRQAQMAGIQAAHVAQERQAQAVSRALHQAALVTLYGARPVGISNTRH